MSKKLPPPPPEANGGGLRDLFKQIAKQTNWLVEERLAEHKRSSTMEARIDSNERRIDKMESTRNRPGNSEFSIGQLSLKDYALIGVILKLVFDFVTPIVEKAMSGGLSP